MLVFVKSFDPVLLFTFFHNSVSKCKHFSDTSGDLTREMSVPQHHGSTL